MNHDNCRTLWPYAEGAPVEELTYQIVGSVLDYRVGDGYGGSGSDSGEWAWETADTSKEGSRRENYPILIQGGSDKKYQCNVNDVAFGMNVI